jgi:hypothetical protein
MKAKIDQGIRQLAFLGTLLTLCFSSCKKAEDLPSPATGSAATRDAVGVSGTKTVCYVEVNNNDFSNVGKYALASGQPLFDIGIIFAANINYNTATQKAVLAFNTQVTNVLTNKATYIQPVQAKGIKVLLSVLGNHQGAGVCNFPTQAAARDFAQQLADAVATYGLDGIDFDDEYADYGTNGTGQPNASSFVYLVSALRELMPDKIISFYYYGPAASRLTYNGVTVGSKVNYSWNAVYGTYSVPNVAGLTKASLGPAAVDIQSTSASTAATLAQRTKTDGYGIYLTYLPNTNASSYLSGVSNALYGQATTYGTSATPASGVSFFADSNYLGAATSTIPKGNYTLSQLQSYGFVNDWASSLKVPTGWSVTMYADDNFTGSSWTLTGDKADFTTLSPTANDKVSSIRIQ